MSHAYLHKYFKKTLIENMYFKAVAYAGGRAPSEIFASLRKIRKIYFPDSLIYKILGDNQFVDTNFVDWSFGRHHSVDKLFRWQVRFVNMSLCRQVRFVDKDIVSCAVRTFRF